MAVNPPEVVWHDLECGSYRADLPLWGELAAIAAGDRHSARILDVGAGTGRVALTLARAGHRVTALDLDADLLGALRERAAEIPVDTVCADARSFELDRADFDLCLLPMQTAQLLGGPAERVAFLKRARAHMRPGGLIAVAIVTVVEPFDTAKGDAGPTPESTRSGGLLYMSRPTRVSVLPRSVVIERERLICSAQDSRTARDVIELQRIDVAELEREAIRAGLEVRCTREVDSTEDHVGSTVVVLCA
jgi:SAM-dependent methyltransferase